jgi:uncharacterized membrane protein HdeD (DUF308 family)
MKALLKNTGGILISIIEIIAGILLLVNPTTFISYIILIVGIFLILSGLVCGIKYFVTPIEKAEASQDFFKALVSLTAGGFLATNKALFVSAEAKTIISYVFGAAILLVGFTKIQNTLDKIRRRQFFIVSIISAAITVACAIIILSKAIALDIIWIFAGITLIVEALMDIADMITAPLVAKKKAKNNEPLEVEVTETKTEE